MKKIISIIVLSMLVMVANAQTVVNGIWEFQNTEKGWTLTKFNGTAADTVVTLPDCVIVNGDCVEYHRVGTFAFYDNPYVTKVTIPHNIKYLESCAINSCSSLTELIISDRDDLGNFFDGGLLTFEYCSIMGYKCPIRKIYMGRNVTDDNGTKDHNGLFSVDDLHEVVFGRFVTEIVDNAFVGNFPDWKSVIIPSNVKRIGRGAFAFIPGLDSITIEDSKEALIVNQMSFYEIKCTDLYIGRNIQHEYTPLVKDGVFPIFYSMSNLLNLVFGKYITDIWEYAFDYTKVNSITIPDNVETIGDGAFQSSPMTNLVIGNGVKRIGDNCFCNSSLACITINSQIPPVCGESTFYDPNSTLLNIPVAAYSQYRDATRWNKFENLCYDGHRFVMGLDVDKSTLSLQVGQSSKINATINPSDAYDKSIVWTSSDPYIASIDENGNVKAKHVGETTMTCTTTDGSNLYRTVVVDVRSALVNEIKLNYDSLVLFEDEKFEIIANVSPSDAALKTVTWTSSDPKVASIDQDGAGHTYNEGTCRITATALDGSLVSATCQIIVKPVLVEYISLNHSSLNLIIGESKQLKATATPDNAKNKNVTWSSSNSSVVSVSFDGNIKAIREGSAIVFAKSVDGSNVESCCMVTVSPILVSSISITPSEINIGLDESYRLICEVLPSDATDRSISWASSASDVATVNDGLIQPHKVGRTVIVATTNDGTNLSAYCIAEVLDKADTYSIAVNTSLQITTSRDAIIINGMSLDSEVQIYDICGHILYKGSDRYVDGLSGGVYFVVIEGHSYKVVL